MKETNNFKLHEEATQLSDTITSYKLSKMYLQQKQELEELKEKYSKLNELFEVIHFALRQLADRYLPKYELDDGPLTPAQHAAIRSASPVSNLPEERITRRLF